MKSSSPGSAQCRSSKTSTTGAVWPPCARRTCARRRTAASDADAGLDAQQRQQRRLDPARSSASGTRCARPSRRPSRAWSPRRRSRRRPARPRTISPSAQKVMPSPYGGLSGRRATRRLDQAVDVLQELPRQPALADAGRADDAHQPRPPLAAGGVEQVLEQAQLVVAADERRLERLAAVAPAALGDDAQRAPCRDGRRLALEHLLARLLEGDRARSRRAGWPRRRARCPAARPTGAAPRC